VRDLLSRTRDFTALFCFNDSSAIRAIQDVGLSCPHDISVIGFDDIIVAEYFNPRLTTVRSHSTKWVQPPQSFSSNVSSPLTNPIHTTSALSPNSS
jgi:LacI family transcriptional regulator